MEKYTSKNIVQSLFNQLEAMSNMFDAREKTIYRTLCELNESSLIGYFSTILTNKFDYIINGILMRYENNTDLITLLTSKCNSKDEELSKLAAENLQKDDVILLCSDGLLSVDQ